MLAIPLARWRRINCPDGLQLSVPEDCTNRKRILPGFQGYIALKRKTAKQLETEEYFLKFFMASAERQTLSNRRIYRASRPRPVQVFATVTHYRDRSVTG
jgi:hypothetical protein